MRHILCIVLLSIFLCTASATSYPIHPDDPSIQTALDYLRTTQKDDGGFGEIGRGSSPGTTSWAILAIFAAGEDPATWVRNGMSPVDYLKDMNAEILAKGGTTDIARSILTFHAVSIDPRDVDGTDYVRELKQRVKHDGQAGDHVFTTIWTIIALASVGEDTRASVRWLTSQQNDDGGYPWTMGAESDPDDTGAALQALSAAGVPKDDPAMKNAVTYLRAMQQDDGGFHYGGTSATNAASDAWVMQGLVAAGVDPSTLQKSSGSVVDHLLSLQNPDGSFRYTAHVTDNPARMTASAIPALLGAPYPIITPVPRQGSFTGITPTEQPDPLPTVSPLPPAGDRVITITDDFLEEVTIHGYPERIISLAPSNTEILFALGLGDRVVGVTDYCDYPADALDMPRVGGYSTVNLEKVVAAKPDLVLASYGNTQDMVDRMRSLGISVVALNPLTLDGVLDNIDLVGTITGSEAEARILRSDLSKRIASVQEKTADLKDRPSAVHLVWYDPLWISGGETFQDEVIHMAGGRNAFGDKDAWAVVGFEDFIVANPEFIIVSSGTGMGTSGYDIIYEYVMTEPRFQNLRAVKKNQVILIDADIISRGSPRIVDALEEVAVAMHPDLFDRSSMNAPAPQGSPIGQAVPIFALLFSAFICWKRT